MKKTLLSLLTIILLSYNVQAQSNAIIFTENGERFYAILNGLRQNDKPQTNVKITGLNASFFKLKVIFEDKNLGEKNFNLALEENMETTVVIKKNPKGEYVLRLLSAVPVAQSAQPRGGQQVIMYDPNAAPYVGTTVTQTTTTTTTGNPDGNVNMGVNIHMDGANINMNVDGGSSSQSSTTTTTTHNTTISGNNPPPAYLPGYNGAIGCPLPVAPGQFADMKKSIESKTFEESKLTIAKQIVNNNCLLSSQVKQVLLLFTFEASRLDFAKYCYGYTYDIGNYYKINDAFTFESSIDELNEYIQTFQR